MIFPFVCALPIDPESYKIYQYQFHKVNGRKIMCYLKRECLYASNEKIGNM
jgi:hypothetical protein